MFGAKKDFGIQHNVMFRVIDLSTNQVVSQHVGHNQATNTILLGVGHYLKGDGVLNQGRSILSSYIPRYISLGTMGLINQKADANGLPLGIGVVDGVEEKRFKDYMDQTPGYGADGYDKNLNHNRAYLGLGPKFSDRDTKNDENPKTVRCELISDSFPRADITYRELIPENRSELSETIDIVYSAMISTGALAQFREPGNPYVFITEAGLWSKKDADIMDPNHKSGYSHNNGLLAGYRIVPPNISNWDMVPTSTTSIEQAKANRELLRSEILRVGVNQVVQVIWKIQIGSMDQLTSTIPSQEIESITNTEIDECFREYMYGEPCHHKF